MYKFRRRALAAVRDVLSDRPRGPKRPHNHVSDDLEQKTVSLCQRHPTFSSYRIAKRLGREAPSPRTIQRIRNATTWLDSPNARDPLDLARRLTLCADREARSLMNEKFYLGPDRWLGFVEQ